MIYIPRGNYLTLTQIAEMYEIGQRAVSNWLSAGKLKGIKIPGLGWIVEVKQLEEFQRPKMGPARKESKNAAKL